MPEHHNDLDFILSLKGTDNILSSTRPEHENKCEITFWGVQQVLHHEHEHKTISMAKSTQVEVEDLENRSFKQ